MIEFLLRQIETFPNPLFTERELLSKSPDSFQDLTRRRILQYHPTPEGACVRLKSPRCPLCGSTLNVSRLKGGYVGKCPIHRDEPPIPVKKEDFFRYAVSVVALLIELRDANNMDGILDKINGHYYVGYKTYGECRVGFVFIQSIGKNKVVDLTGLKLLCKGDHILVVLTPAYEIENVAVRGMLRHEKIVQTSLASSLNQETFELPIKKLLAGLLDEGKGQELTDQQRLDYEKYEYLCYDKVHIPGKSPVRRSNIIYVSGNTVKIGDSLFTLLLRLVAELKKGQGGWVDIHTLHADGIISDPGKYQIYSRLRKAVAGSLLEKDGKRFVEGDGAKRYRVSMHPDFIT